MSGFFDPNDIVPAQVTSSDSNYGVSDEKQLMEEAKRAGITGKELAAFMAQMAHESADFQKLSEIGGGSGHYSGGKKFKGRGYIQLTHDYNYKDMGNKLGVNLVGNPDLAADPKIARQVAIRFWMDNVRPKVKNWDDVFSHSRAINNPRAQSETQVRGYEDRKAKYKKYRSAIGSENPYTIVQIGNTTAQIPNSELNRLLKDHPDAKIIK